MKSILFVSAIAIVMAGCVTAPANSSTAPAGKAAPSTEAAAPAVSNLPAPDMSKPVLDRAVTFYVPHSLNEALEQAALFASEAAASAAAEKQYKAFLDMSEKGTTPENEAAFTQQIKSVQEEYKRIVDEECNRFEAFFRAYPSNWYAHNRLAWFLDDHFRQDQAAEQWRKVIEMEPRFPYAYNNLGSLYNHMGRDLEAIRLFRKAIDLYPFDAVFYMNLGDNYFTHRYEAMEEFGWDLPQTFRATINCYRRASEISQNDPDVVHDWAMTYAAASKFNVTDIADEELSVWQYYLTLDLSSQQRANGLCGVSRVLIFQKKDYATAAGLLHDALKLEPEDATAMTLLDKAEKGMRGELEKPAAEETER